MDKEQETLDLALDIPNTIRLNPFDRSPNIMDDELNSVTQEELEANLSADCPSRTIETTPAQNCNDMWEKLIQSFLEDNSTQDGIVQTVEKQPTAFESENICIKNKTYAEIKLNEETLNLIANDTQTFEEIQSISNCKNEAVDEAVKTIPDKIYIKDGNVIVNNTAEEEQLLSICTYDLNENDVQNDICQVEVYATDNDTFKEQIPENVKGTFFDDSDDDGLSDVSAMSVGYLVPIEKENCTENSIKESLKQTQLSTIINDHCYSQEVPANASGCDLLKQNVVNHIMKQNSPNLNLKQIENIVDKMLNTLGNNNLDVVLKALNICDVKEENKEVNIDEENTFSVHKNEELSEKGGGHNKENGDTTRLNEKQLHFPDMCEMTVEKKSVNNLLDVKEEISEIFLGQILEETRQTEENIEIEKDQTNDKQVNEDQVEYIDNKIHSGSLHINSSEKLEAKLFDEEFGKLWNAGTLSLTKDTTKSTACVQLWKNLKDFISQMQRDCEDLKDCTVEDKLIGYVTMKYNSFRNLFVFKQSVETQTKSKKLTKRKRIVQHTGSLSNLSKMNDNSIRYSSTSSSSISSSSCDENDDKVTTKSYFKSNLLLASKINSLGVSVGNSYNAADNGQEYDDGINLSQYVQSEVFNTDSLSPQSTMISDSDCDSLKEDDASAITSSKQPSNSDNNCGDSDDTIIFKINSKNSRNSKESLLLNSIMETQKQIKSEDEKMSVHSESDKENLTSDCKERKPTESLDEDEKNDREIDRLTNISGLAKRSVCNTSAVKSADKSRPKTVASKALNDFDFMDIEFDSENEVKSEAEEDMITEQQFLKNYNEDLKRQMLDDSSTDSDVLEDEDDELLKTSSEEDDEGCTKSPLVEKFLKTFVVDDSDNDIEDNDDDDDIDLDSDKDEEKRENEKHDNKGDDANADIEKTDKDDEIPIDGAIPTKAEMELLNDNFLFRKRAAKPQKLDKMLSDAEKRKNISKIDAELISLSSDSSNSDVEAVDVDANQKPRSLKPMLRPDQLAGETIKAQKRENERISRLEKKHVMLDKVLKEYPEVDKNKELILDYIKETKTFIKVHPDIVKYLKPHQFDGVRFMYDSCYGGVDSLKKSPGSGCILAHCMGLGKTLQLISLLHTVISYKELKTTKILVLCPKSTVMNWADEIIRWLGPLRQKNVKVYTFSDTSDINEKLSIVKEWSLSNHSRSGCLLIGYEAFRTLVFYHSYKNRGNINSERLEEIRLHVNKYLLAPGADLVVCDEGHIIKNSNSAISKAVAKIETPRRIVLTGTPIQNNLKEYYSMVNFIKPLFLGTEKEFANLYANPIKNGQHKDSGKTDIKIMKQRSFVLHKKLSKFVQRKEAELLKTFLPMKFEYVLFIPMTEVQNNLYQHILNAIKNRDEHYRGKGLITDYTCLRKIWTHPKVLEDAWKNAVSQRNKREIRNKLLGHNSDDDQPDDIYDSQTGQMSVTNDWWRHLVKEINLESVMPSNKLRTMFKILQMCQEKGEKCLIFSAFVAVLNVVEYFFKKITDNDGEILNELNISGNSKWILGQDYYRLDGKTPKSIRHAMINEFNNGDNKTARVFLISAKAGGQGINLIGANRVIILDTSWNPSNDQQNIFRVFRLGQKRCCYIYRLLAMGTMEEKVYSRSVTKQAMSFRVVDEQQIDRHYNMAELAELYTLTIPDIISRPTPILPQDSILARLLRAFPDLVYKYHEHDSLLENKVEQELSEQEKNEAWTAYERDLQMNSEVKEMPNLEDFQNKLNISNISNYLSPFSGLDMSHLLGYNTAFNPNFVQSLMSQNTNSSLNTQQYLDMYNYYKNLGSAYADINPYASLSGISGGGGRMTTSSAVTSVPTNPLAALGDLSMFRLTSPGLQSLGANSAAMNLPNSLGGSATLQQMPTSASMYTSPSAMNTNLPITSASNMATGGLVTASNSAAVLSAFEQLKQSFRGSYNSMYNYTGDFGLSSSGSTILDNTKTKNSKQGSANSKSVNLPGGSKGGSVMGLFSGPPSYMPQPQAQPQIQQQHPQQHRPNSRNTPNYDQHQQQQLQQQHHHHQQQQQLQQQHKNNVSVPSSKSCESSVSGKSSNLLNYRRSESSTLTAPIVGKKSSDTLTQNKPNQITQQKQCDVDGGNDSNTKSMAIHNNIKSNSNVANLLSSNHKRTTSKSNNNNSTNTTSSINSNKSISSSTNSPSAPSLSAQTDSNRSVNMGISYPNSKSAEKPLNKGNSTLNMGIVYPKSSNKSSSEMQIIPTTSPPGTISISKQLNELSPSISLTALKTNVPNKIQQNLNTKSNNSSATVTNAQNFQLNKIMQNSNTRRNTSPINTSIITSIGSKSSIPNLNASSSVSSSLSVENQSNLLERIKPTNNKKSVNAKNSNPVPPLQRTTTMVGIPTTNASSKTLTGLTITNVKNTLKNPNLITKSGTISQQPSTLAKQTAAAAVAKSNLNRLNNTNIKSSDNLPIQKNLNSTANNTTLPSLTAFKRIVKRSSPSVNVSSSSSLTANSSNKLPVISSVKSISQYTSSMPTLLKSSINKVNNPLSQASNVSTTFAKSSSSTFMGANHPSTSKTISQMQKRLPTSQPTPTTSTTPNSSNSVNIRPVDDKQNPSRAGGVYIIETNINDKKLAIGAPTKNGGGTTVTKVPTKPTMKRKSTDPSSKDKIIEAKRLKN